LSKDGHGLLGVCMQSILHFLYVKIIQYIAKVFYILYDILIYEA